MPSHPDATRPIQASGLNGKVSNPGGPYTQMVREAVLSEAYAFLTIHCRLAGSESSNAVHAENWSADNSARGPRAERSQLAMDLRGLAERNK